MNIKQISNPWRDRYQEAAFRNAQFYVETDARSGGRRIALHEYPKRNVPYAEDMGRKALRFLVQGYLIGPNYWDQKNRLIAELEKDGPGQLRLPLPYQMADVKVIVMSFTTTEARERGGYCQVDMDFVEYGDPEYRQQVSTTGQIEDSTFKVEDQLIGPIKSKTEAQVQNMWRYGQVRQSATGGDAWFVDQGTWSS
jgi:hypothetical protein